MMSELKLEVGKSYLNRMGNTIKIVRKYAARSSVGVRFEGNTGRVYEENGESLDNSVFGLVSICSFCDTRSEERNRATTPLQLEVGKTYITKKCDKVKIVRQGKLSPKGFNFWGDSGRHYSPSGKSWVTDFPDGKSWVTDSYDLVDEYNPSSMKSEKSYTISELKAMSVVEFVNLISEN
jgi:hypothetical protein